MATTARPRILPSGKVSWRVQFRVNGKVTSESFRDEKEATKFARLVDRVGGDAAMRTRDARDSPGKDVPTLTEWVATWLDPATGHLIGVTPGTRRGYQDVAQRSFLNVLGELPLDVITKQEIAKWVAWQEAQPSKQRPGQSVAAKTIRNYHGVLSSALAAAVDARLITHNAAKGTRLARGMREGVTFLTHDEFDRILEHVPDYYKPLTLWLVWSGMRWGEATALTWADIDFQSEPPTARITKAWKKGPTRVPVLGPPKTRRSVRTIVMPRWVVDRLGDRGKPTDLIFTGMRSGEFLWSQRYYKSAWVPALAKAGLEKRPRVHDLRHSHASWLIAAGLQPFQIQARLGHESITTTYDLYGHLMPDANQQMSDTLMLMQVDRSNQPNQLKELA